MKQFLTHRPVDTTKQEPPVWSALMACLAQLSQYGISSADDEISDTSGRTRSPQIQKVQSDENEGENTNVPVTIFSRTFNELFSWHLVSEKFVAVVGYFSYYFSPPPQMEIYRMSV